MTITPAFQGDFIIACAYDDTGLARIDMWDAQALGWRFDETVGWKLQPNGIWVSVDLPSTRQAPQPEIIDQLPDPPPDTDPVISPSWARCSYLSCVAEGGVFRGYLADFFTFLSQNNGAERLLSAAFLHSDIVNEWNKWAKRNPDWVAP